MLQLTFNPGLTLTGFRTTLLWPLDQFWKIFGNVRKVAGNVRKIARKVVIYL